MRYMVAAMLALLTLGITAAQSQGSVKKTANNGLSFTCEGGCNFFLDHYGDKDYVQLQGEVIGDGAVVVGFYDGAFLMPLDIVYVDGVARIDDVFPFSRNLEVRAKNTTLQLMVRIEGDMQGDIQPIFGSFTRMQHWKQVWRDLWRHEPMTLYSINHRYGTVVHKRSLVRYGYVIVLLGVILLFLWKRKKSWGSIWWCCIGMFMLLGLRQQFAHISFTVQGRQDYHQPVLSSEREFFEMRDAPVFAQKLRQFFGAIITNEQCSVYVETEPYRPYFAQFTSVYTQPCMTVDDKQDAQYILYYKTPIPLEDRNKPILFNFDGSFLLDARS